MANETTPKQWMEQFQAACDEKGLELNLNDENDLGRLMIYSPTQKRYIRFKSPIEDWTDMADAVRVSDVKNALEAGARLFAYGIQKDTPHEITISADGKPQLSEQTVDQTPPEKPKGIGFWKRTANILSFGQAYKDELKAYHDQKAEYKKQMGAMKSIEDHKRSRAYRFEEEGELLNNKVAAREAAAREAAAKEAAAKEAAAKEAAAKEAAAKEAAAKEAAPKTPERTEIPLNDIMNRKLHKLNNYGEFKRHMDTQMAAGKSGPEAGKK